MQVSKSRTSAIKAAKDAIKTAIKANIMPKGYYIANITGRCHCGETPAVEVSCFYKDAIVLRIQSYCNVCG